MTLLAAVPACSGVTDLDHPANGSASQEIISGTPVTTDTLGTALFNFSDGTTGWGCSGTVIRGNWLLTTHHCVTVGNAITGGTAVNPANITASILNGSSTTGVAIFRHPSLDVALVELASPLLNPATNTPFTTSLYTGQVSSLVGSTAFCEGWGDNTFTSGFGTLRSANEQISQMDGTSYRIVPNSSGQIDWEGDSGSSCFSGNHILGVQSTCNTSNSTVVFCDQVAVDQFYGWATAILTAQTFAATSLSQVVTLGSNGNLWLESPNGVAPPPRTQIDGNALSFQTLPGVNVTSDIFVLGSDGNLWLESPNGAVPPPRTQVDANVQVYQALSTSSVFALGNDGRLWLETPNGSVPPPRTQVDANVRSFQAIDSSHVVVLGTDTKLWLESAPFGSVPPSRIQIDAQALAFQAIDTGHIFVLGSDGKLWLETPNGSVPPPRTQVDGNAVAFQALSTSSVFVLGSDSKLWLETPNGSVPPPRNQVDGSVAQFKAFDAGDVVTLGLDGNLWFEHGPFTTVPPNRQFIDRAVRP